MTVKCRSGRDADVSVYGPSDDIQVSQAYYLDDFEDISEGDREALEGSDQLYDAWEARWI